MSSMGKRFKQQCEFVHKIADDVIKKRRQTLVFFLISNHVSTKHGHVPKTDKESL